MDREQLLLDLEDEFLIHISDDEGAAAQTVGDLYRLVLGKLEPTAVCLAGKAFYRARRALAGVLDMPPRSIRPDTRLEPLLPVEKRIRLWAQTADRMDLHFPKLTYSQRWRDLMLVLSMAIAAPPVGALWWALYALDWIGGIGVRLFFFPALLAWIVIVSRVNERLLRLTARRAVEFPPGVITAGDLSLSILSRNPGLFELGVISSRHPSKETVCNRIMEILSAQPGVHSHAVAPKGALPDNWVFMEAE